MTPDDAIAALGGDPIKSVGMAAYHKIDRPYLGVANPDIDTHVKAWRAELTLDARLDLAEGLWATNIHEGRVAAAKLLTQARIRPDVETWITSDHKWTKRAALVMTLPWAKQNNPKPQEAADRERILGWAATYVPDHDWFIQKSIAWWLRDLSNRDPARVQAFLDTYGDQMKPFAKKEAASKLPAAS